MKIMKGSLYSVAAFALMLPVWVHAQGGWAEGGSGEIDRFGKDIINFIDNVITPFMFAVALVLFIYGAFLFLIASGGDGEERQKGRQFMFWGIIALVIIVSLWGIVNLISGGLGFGDDEDIDEYIPRASQSS